MIFVNADGYDHCIAVGDDDNGGCVATETKLCIYLPGEVTEGESKV